MAVELIAKPLVSQSLGSIQGLSPYTSLQGSRSPQELSADANWFRQALGPSTVTEPSVMPGINNAFQKISADFNKVERKTLDLAKRPDPAKMLEHSFELSQSMFRIATLTKVSAQLGRSFDKLTSLG